MAKDGGLIVGALNDGQFKRLCKAIEMEELATDERFLHNPDRVKNRDILIPLLQERISTKTIAEWMKIFDAAEVPYAPINKMQEVFSDSQVLHRGMLQEVEHPTAGKIKMVGIPVKYSDTPASIRLPPPTLGQHTEEILISVLGYDQQKIQRLKKDGVCYFGK
jgi:succinate--hydroxymethylglutarate CoA-transferase